MHEFFAKIARHAFGKGAAFCYAVTVAVSGQLAYNYLQPRNTAPMPVSVAVPVPAPASDSGAAIVAPIPAAPPSARAPRDRTDPAGTLLPVASKPGGAACPRAETALAASSCRPHPLEKPASTVAAKPASLPDMPSLDMPLHPQPAEAARPAGTADAAVAAPIPLLPAAGAAEVEKAAVPIRPGPGSGGLY